MPRKKYKRILIGKNISLMQLYVEVNNDYINNTSTTAMLYIRLLFAIQIVDDTWNKWNVHELFAISFSSILFRSHDVNFATFIFHNAFINAQTHTNTWNNSA